MSNISDDLAQGLDDAAKEICAVLQKVHQKFGLEVDVSVFYLHRQMIDSPNEKPILQGVRVSCAGVSALARKQ